MAKRQQTAEEVQETLVERLAWQTAGRDDRQAAQAVHAGEELDAVYPLGEVGLLDEFYHFLEISGVLTLIASLELADVQRVFLPVVQFVLLYLLKTLLGIESMNALPTLLFSNVAAMTLLGFNAYQIANGLTHRGDDKRTDRPKHGSLSPQCLAQNLSKFTTAQWGSTGSGNGQFSSDAGGAPPLPKRLRRTRSGLFLGISNLLSSRGRQRGMESVDSSVQGVRSRQRDNPRRPCPQDRARRLSVRM